MSVPLYVAVEKNFLCVCDEGQGSLMQKNKNGLNLLISNVRTTETLSIALFKVHLL